MTIDTAASVRLRAGFAPLNAVGAKIGFPAPNTLSSALSKLVPADKTETPVKMLPKTATDFATAAVDMWLRSVHSFLISAGLTRSSPIWASVSGYYSSHYSIRSLAHVLGRYQLFQRKRAVRLAIEGGVTYCYFKSKDGDAREHDFYWKILKSSAPFSGDPLFDNLDPSGSANLEKHHREKANYADNLGGIPNFSPMTEAELIERINHISQIQFDQSQLPSVEKFPDLDNVQIVAYHRLVRVRALIDDVVGPNNRFWKVHRNPTWARGFMDFQVNSATPLQAMVGR